jgi:hypothetical protein
MKVKIEDLQPSVLLERFRAMTGGEVEAEPAELETSGLRRTLIALLGGRCMRCGTEQNLRLHHIHGGGTALRDHFGHRGELLRIATEWNNGNYAVACHSCHSKLEPPTIRRWIRKCSDLSEKLHARAKRETDRLYDGSFGSSQRGDCATSRYLQLFAKASERCDRTKFAKKLYGIE